MLFLVRECRDCGEGIFKPYKASKKQWEELYKLCDNCRQKVWKSLPHKMLTARYGEYKPKKMKPKKYKIAFVWQGVSNETIKDKWCDGLRYAIDKIAKTHKIDFFEPWHDIEGYDVILYWEAPITAQGENAPHYNKVRNNPAKKALLFAGGPIKKEWVNGFDLLFLESKINEKECDDLGIPWHHAFGINNKKFIHLKDKEVRKYDGMLHGTCASWKRQWLLGEAFGPRACLIGKTQDSDAYPFNRCRELGSDIFPEAGPAVIRDLMRDSYTLVNPCDYWGGGQRATLEAMAVGLPVVCCTDSPKNREFVEESGFGIVCEPDAQSIKNAVQYIKDNPMDWRIGVNYVKNGWSGDVYAKQLLEGLKKILW